MALLFSKVTLDSEYEKSSFLVGGYPTGSSDLEGYTAYEDFLSNMDYGAEINVHADVYTYGEKERFDAKPEEIAYLTRRMESDPLFLEEHCNFVEDTDFFIDYYPDYAIA